LNVDSQKQEAGAKLLEEMLAKRGYLLSYHRMLAASDPGILSAYENLYTRLVLNERALNLAEREIVWIALIVVTRVRYATFHFERATQGGLDDASIVDSAAIGAACESFDALHFNQNAFAKWLPEEQAMQRYFAMFDTARGNLPPAIAEVAAVVCHGALGNAAGMRAHFARAFKLGATTEQMAEGISYLLQHRGGPTMIDAVNCWESAAKEFGIPGPY